MNVRINKLYNNLILFLLFWCTLQDVLLSIIYKITNSIFICNILFYSKDVLMLALFFLAIKYLNKKIALFIFGYFIMIGITILLMFIRDEGTSLQLSVLFHSIRNVILLPVFASIGWSIQEKDDLLTKIIRKFFPFVVFCSVLGIIDYFMDIAVGTKSFWTNTLGYTRYYIDIKHEEKTMLFGLPGNFYGSYGKGYFSVKRLVGPWGNPLTSAYCMVIPFLYYFINAIKKIGKNKFTSEDKKNILYSFILIISVYFTHTRLVIIALIIVCLYYLIVYNKRKVLLLVIFIVSSFLIIFNINFDTLQRVLYDGSSKGHIENVSGAINNIKLTLFGNGFGYMGVLGDIGTESFFLTLLGNMGIIGLLAYLIIYFYLMFNCKNNLKNSILSLSVFLACIVYFISGFVSEQLCAYTSSVQFYILLGFTSHNVRREGLLNDNRY